MVWECSFRVWKCPNIFVQITQYFVNIVCIDSKFWQKVVLTNLIYSNLMKYNILYRVTKVQLINKRIMWSKRPKNAKKTFFNNKLCVLSLNFGHEVSFTIFLLL